MLEPIKLPNDKAFSFLTAAITEAANSGTLVPIAMTVAAITASLTPNAVASSLAPSTNQTDPK